MLEKEFREFLRTHVGSAPLLLGLSGGPDSTALFYLLLEAQHPFEVAHVDHRWRPSSENEAASLEALASSHGIPYHLKILTKTAENNLEERARQSRHHFYREICVDRGLKGVLLGHHGDDQAETVLKRVFEGATLPKLAGLNPVAQREGLLLLRPLLNVRKSLILRWLKEKGISYFEDETNLDTRFLRGRCRSQLLPALSDYFGKEIVPSLCRLARLSQELQDFIEEQLKPFRLRVVQQEKGVLLDLHRDPPTSLFLWKAVVKDLFDKEGIALPSSVLETLVKHLRTNSPKRELRVGRCIVTVNRSSIFLSNQF